MYQIANIHAILLDIQSNLSINVWIFDGI